MFMFTFWYSDGKNIVIRNVISATVQTRAGTPFVVLSEKILDYIFPLDMPISLRSSEGNSSISVDGLRAIQITSES